MELSLTILFTVQWFLFGNNTEINRKLCLGRSAALRLHFRDVPARSDTWLKLFTMAQILLPFKLKIKLVLIFSGTRVGPYLSESDEWASCSSFSLAQLEGAEQLLAVGRSLVQPLAEQCVVGRTCSQWMSLPNYFSWLWNNLQNGTSVHTGAESCIYAHIYIDTNSQINYWERLQDLAIPMWGSINAFLGAALSLFCAVVAGHSQTYVFGRLCKGILVKISFILVDSTIAHLTCWAATADCLEETWSFLWSCNYTGPP